jgi:hypothetical protein
VATARFARRIVGEPSVSGFARDRQRDPERRSSVLTTQRSEKPETPNPDLVFQSAECAHPPSSAPRIRPSFSCAARVATSLTALSIAACLESRLRWPGPFAKSLARVPGWWNQPDNIFIHFVFGSLENQHGVAVAEESVTTVNRLGVSGASQVKTRKGAHQDKQATTG